ncbi:MAG: hypothetical protein KC502_18585 [Myxococcales bacterium]|nr:hypothetical protein [Myxococcales bacterium]
MHRIAIGLSLILSCCAAQPPAPPPPPKPIPVAKLLEGVQTELAKMQKLYDLRARSGRLLATLNGKLQSRGFSRRVPSQPAEPALASDLRSHATALGLRVTDWKVHVRKMPAVPAKGPNLGPAELWATGAKDLRGVVDARISLVGPRPAIVGFIDRIPNHVERAVLVTGQSPLPNGITLHMQAFYERVQPRPQMVLKWPTLEDRLEAAGWKLNDPALPKDPSYRKLHEAVKQGRARIPDLRGVMNVAADFPRWFARAELLDELTGKILEVHASEVLKTKPIAPETPFPPAP